MRKYVKDIPQVVLDKCVGFGASLSRRFLRDVFHFFHDGPGSKESNACGAAAEQCDADKHLTFMEMGIANGQTSIFLALMYRHLHLVDNFLGHFEFFFSRTVPR